MIKFESVTKFYRLVNGINDVTMELKTGAHGLLGPNGSGKTTMINLITGQLQPTIGRVTVFGENPWGKEQMLSRIGLCPAVDVLYSNVSAFNWVNYQNRLMGFSRKEAKERTLDALSTVGMSDSMHRKIGGYSLGMRQRTKLAQAIAHDPDLLILDEPYNGLDPIGRQEMTNLLHKLLERGKSILLASHVLHEVEEIDPSLLLLSEGRLLAQGPPAEIREVLAAQAHESKVLDRGEGAASDNSSAPVLEVFIRSSDNYLLAKKLFDHSRLSTIQLSQDESELTVGTSDVETAYQSICQVAVEEGLAFYELRSTDGTLDDLFSSLMKIHRGEH